ncbi:hypothetical protein [Salinimicrobium sp. GXAS 041]|uniref:hypothetical protein n=1 Tax=Salinimicrobium sp. GXAS 041 TaxID=3400806 RepID=UPI003C744DCB
MANIREMLNRTIQAKQGIEPEMMNIVNRLSEKIIDLNREGQLFQGKNTAGKIIGVYSKNTETKYGGAEKGKYAGDPYNFEDTGDLFKAFTINFHDGKIDIFSTDSKVPMLKQRYEKGEGKLFGLTLNHEMELNYEILKPELLKFIKRTLYNG